MAPHCHVAQNAIIAGAMALAAAAPIPADAEQAPLNLSILQTAPYAGQSEDWSIHLQYTLIGEGDPRYRSPY
jgi:hypothetical protein